MKNALVIVSLSAILAGCASMSPQTAAERSEAPAPALAAHDAPAAAETRSDAADTPEAALPAATLTPEVMYKLLAAEISYQRGQWQSAYVTILGVAQQTRDPRLARRAAEIAMSVKQSGEALAAIRLWHELAPSSDEATQYLLGFLVISGRMDEARPLLEQRLHDARPATRGIMLLQMQRMLSRAKDKAAGFALLDQLAAPYAKQAETHVALAQGAFHNGDTARARSEAAEALRIKPDSELAALVQAQVTPDKDEAAKGLERFLAANPKARDVRVAYARMLIEAKESAKARAQFETVLKYKPDDLGALYAIGVLSAQDNDAKTAEKFLTRYLDVLRENPDDERDPTQAYLLLAQIAEDRKDSEGALKWLSQVEAGDNWLLAQLRRAQIMAKRGDLPGARHFLQELKPEGERDQAQVAIAEAQLLRDANQVPEALRVLEAALKQYPDNTDLLYDYAMVAEKADNLALMEKSLRRVMELTPANQHAYNALGYSLAERNIRLDEAKQLIEKALSLAPDDPFIMDSMGWVLFRLGKHREAEDLLRRAYSLRPDPEIATHLGEVLWTNGRREDAQQYWRDARRKDPQNDTLRSTLARLHVSL